MATAVVAFGGGLAATAAPAAAASPSSALQASAYCHSMFYGGPWAGGMDCFGSASGGVAPYHYYWMNGQNTFIEGNTGAAASGSCVHYSHGTVRLRVTDANGQQVTVHSGLFYCNGPNPV